jgi:hypothetical protein
MPGASAELEAVSWSGEEAASLLISELCAGDAMGEDERSRATMEPSALGRVSSSKMMSAALERVFLVAGRTVVWDTLAVTIDVESQITY